MQYPQITSLSLKNFRSFQSASGVPLRRLTFVVGPNSSGKTSLAHGVFLLAQSGLLSLEHISLAWSGGLAELGSFEDCVFGHDPGSAMSIGLTISGARLWPHHRRKSHFLDADFRLAYELRSGDDPGGYVSSIHVTDSTSGKSLTIKRRRGRHPSFSVHAGSEAFIWKPASEEYGFSQLHMRLTGALRKSYKRPGPSKNDKALKRLEDFVMSLLISSTGRGIQRVSSARFGPRRLYERRTLVDPNMRTESVAPLLSSITPEMVEDFHVSRKPQWRSRAIDKRQIQRQLLELNIADDLSVREISAYHRAIYLRDNKTGVAGNLVDYGYGVSQVLPVLWGLASGGPGMLVLEQPEVHLHPRAQGLVGEYIVTAARSRQIVVETHSEHIINRARIAVAKGAIDPDHVMILYVDRGDSGSRVAPIRIDRSGDFVDQWPHGFFEERFEDALQLAQLRS